MLVSKLAAWYSAKHLWTCSCHFYLFLVWYCINQCFFMRKRNNYFSQAEGDCIQGITCLQFFEWLRKGWGGPQADSTIDMTQRSGSSCCHCDPCHQEKCLTHSQNCWVTTAVSHVVSLSITCKLCWQWKSGDPAPHLENSRVGPSNDSDMYWSGRTTSIPSSQSHTSACRYWKLLHIQGPSNKGNWDM